MDNLTVVVSMISHYAPVEIIGCLMMPIFFVAAKTTKGSGDHHKFISFGYEDPTLNAYGDEDDEW